MLDIPATHHNASDLLPLGAFVSGSGNDDREGLVVVMPTSGKIFYWEAVNNADTLELLRNRKIAVEHTIPNMGSDTVKQIINAEENGYILAFRSGKLAYMSITKKASGPTIAVQYLSSHGSFKGGIFGSIRGFLPGSFIQEEIAAVRAGPAKEHDSDRNFVVVTIKGKIQSWHIQRGGFGSLVAQVEGREALVTAMKQKQPALLSTLLLESFEVLDFTYARKTTTDVTLLDDRDSGENGVTLLLLASLTDRNRAYYCLIEVTVKRGELIIGYIKPIKSYKDPISRLATCRPRLYLPDPAVAFAVFDRDVVVISVAKHPDSPELQLRSESHTLPKGFEDEVVHFDENTNVEIVGSGMEEAYGKSKHPSTVLLLRGRGVIRIAADREKLSSSHAHQITAKSKLEQAVFYGNLENNPVSFKVQPELQFPPEEVGAAALELSLDILMSKIAHIPSVNASIDSSLTKRAEALRHLAEHLQDTGVDLDRATRWQLLCNAEKIEAASRIWKSYDASVRTNPKGQRRGLMADIVDYINESHKTNPVAAAGELDRVRHWFIHDVVQIDIVLPWAYEVMKYSYQDGQHEHDFVLHSLSEADDIVISALKGAFDFRTANLSLYGLHEEPLKHGILTRNYEGLPEFWTSTSEIVKKASKQASIASALLGQYCNPDHASSKALADPAVPEKIRLENPRLLDVIIRSTTERIRWASAQNSPQLQLEADELKSNQAQKIDEQITALVDLELAEEAIALAEKHHIMPTLATIIMLQIRFHGSHARQLRLSDEEYKKITPEVATLEKRVEFYFEKFGKEWATAFYEHNIEVKAMANLLEAYQDQRVFLTEFLRSKPEYAKLSWLHEVLREQNFEQAADTLLNLGLKHEQDLWSKKIELSMGKLARMASRKYSQANGLIIPDGGEAELADATNQLGLVKIQDQIYDHVLPSIETAIDDKAEVPLALESHGNKFLKNKQEFSQLLEIGMARLIKHESMDALSLIDLLTLMDGDENSDEHWEFRSQQFCLALQALQYRGHDKDDFSLVQQIIWRRCMLRDNWALVNNTEGKSDHEVNDSLRTTALYLTYKACHKKRKLLPVE